MRKVCLARTDAGSVMGAADARGNSSGGRPLQTWNELQAEGVSGGDEYLAEAAANWTGGLGALPENIVIA